MRKITYKESIPENLKKMAMPSFNSSRNSVGLEKSVGEYFFIPLGDLIPFKNQARKYFDPEELETLAHSIKEHGVRQPLTVLPFEEEKGKYEIVSGERRFRAAKLIGLDRVPCIVIHDKRQAEEIALIENIHREDLHPIELGNAYKRLLDKNFVASQYELSKKISVKESSISEHLKFCELPTWIQEYMINHNIRSRDTLRQVVKHKDNTNKIEIILGMKENAGHTIKEYSVLRITNNVNGFKVQALGMKKLNKQEKVRLKKQLLELVETLEI